MCLFKIVCGIWTVLITKSYKEIESHSFENYLCVSSCQAVDSTGVALLIRKDRRYAPITFQDREIDNVWTMIEYYKKMLLIGGLNVLPNMHMKREIAENVMEKAKNYSLNNKHRFF